MSKPKKKAQPIAYPVPTILEKLIEARQALETRHADLTKQAGVLEADLALLERAQSNVDEAITCWGDVTK